MEIERGRATSLEGGTLAGWFDRVRPRPAVDRIERALRDGERYLRERQWDVAERAFDFACLQNPADPRPYLGLAMVHHAHGAVQRADEAFDGFRTAVAASKLTPADRAAMLAAGYERLGELAEARREWEEVLSLDSTAALPHESLARLCEASGDLIPARTHYDWLAKRQPERADWPRAISRVALAQGDLEAATAAREAALRQTKDAADRLVDTFELARLHRQLGYLDLALEELRSCATLDPNWPEVRRELGYLHLQRAEWSAARRALAEYLAIAPNAPDRETVQRQAEALQDAPEDVAESSHAAGSVRGSVAPPPTIHAPVVVVYGLQGGVGRTTVVANLGVWLAKSGERVGLVDLASATGELALHLDLRPSIGLAELAREFGEQKVDWSVIVRALAKHRSGLHLLLGSTSPLAAELVTESLIRRVLPVLQLNYGWLLIDAPPDVSDRTLAILEQARLVLLVASPDVVGHQAVRAAIQVCDTLNVPARRRRIIWHATRGQSAQLDGQVAEWFPLETHRFLPHAGDEFRAETQLGQPLVQRKARHRWTRELASLAQEFAV
jgi:MinD-like ATPase involved in chromosome partitioning or flagellar assembly/Flp pilus assembly protein TadD